MTTIPTIVAALRKGDRITDGQQVGTIVNNPIAPKRKPGHLAFDVRVGPTMYAVCLPDTDRVDRVA